MTNSEVHILIDQGLQSVGSFAYQDMLTEEVDLQINYVINSFISDKLDKFEKKQEGLDDLSLLIVKDKSLTINTFASYVYCSLPPDYRHLLNDRSAVKVTCVENRKTISKVEEVPNRLIGSEVLHNALKDSFSKTRSSSPLSNLKGDVLYIYTEGFAINNVIVDYIKKPNVVNTVVSPTGVWQFPDAVVYKIIEGVIKHISVITEQPQQKIVNLQSEIQN